MKIQEPQTDENVLPFFVGLIRELNDLGIGDKAGYVHEDKYYAGTERSSDPPEPAEGQFIIWMSDGTGKGDAGDVLIASNQGGTTTYATLFDYSAGGAW